MSKGKERFRNILRIFLRELWDFVSTVFSIRRLAYQLIFILGLALIWTGLKISILEYIEDQSSQTITEEDVSPEQNDPSNTPTYLAATYIGVGASISAVYLTHFLQKLTVPPITRREWVEKIGTCNDALICFLLECNGISMHFETRQLHSKKFKVTASQEVTAPLANARNLERALRKQGIGFILQLNNRQLKELKALILDVSPGIDKVHQKYGYTFTNREFTKDLVDLESSLKWTVESFEMLDTRKTSTIRIFTPTQSSSSDKIKIAKKTRRAQHLISMEVHPSSLKQIQANPVTSWIAINLTDYLLALAAFMSNYGYSNNMVRSLIKSRFFYLRKK